jgi:hypothetical protein
MKIFKYYFKNFNFVLPGVILLKGLLSSLKQMPFWGNYQVAISKNSQQGHKYYDYKIENLLYCMGGSA